MLSRRDKRFFEMARKKALKSDYNTFHLGCVVVYKNHVISSGFNTNKTSPVQKKYNKIRCFRPGERPINHSLHAEISALTKVQYNIAQEIDWNQVSIYIYRISPGKESGHGLARPCPSCMQAIKDYGIKNIYYTTDDGFVYEEIV